MSHGLPQCKNHLIAKTIDRPRRQKLGLAFNQFEIAEGQGDDERAKTVV